MGTPHKVECPWPAHCTSSCTQNRMWHYPYMPVMHLLYLNLCGFDIFLDNTDGCEMSMDQILRILNMIKRKYKFNIQEYTHYIHYSVKPLKAIFVHCSYHTWWVANTFVFRSTSPPRFTPIDLC